MTVPADGGALARKKFLMIVNDMDWFRYHRLPFAKAILAAGASLHLATHNAVQDAQIKEMGITGHELPVHVAGVNPLAQLRLIAALVKILRDVRPDIVHAITLRFAMMTGLAAMIVAPRTKMVFTMAGLGLLFSSHAPKMRFLRLLLIPILRLVFDRTCVFVIFENPDDRALMLRHGIVREDRSAVILGSGVDLAQFPYSQEQVHAKPVVLFSSRLLKDKGIGEFVEASRILRARGIDADFTVAGKTYPANLNSVTDAQMEGWVREGAITWLGLCTDMPALFSKCSLFVLPSYYGEGVPRVLLEAASAGRAIITTDMPGCRETVRAGVNGILIPPRDAGALADAIAGLLQDAPLRQKMGVQGRALMESAFSVEKVISSTLDAYRRLLAGG